MGAVDYCSRPLNILSTGHRLLSDDRSTQEEITSKMSLSRHAAYSATHLFIWELQCKVGVRGGRSQRKAEFSSGKMGRNLWDVRDQGIFGYMYEWTHPICGHIPCTVNQPSRRSISRILGVPEKDYSSLTDGNQLEEGRPQGLRQS